MRLYLSFYPFSLLKKVIFGLLVASVLSGCASTKTITYFQPYSPNLDEGVRNIRNVYTPTIKPGDILAITVNGLSSDDRELFNQPYMTSQYSQSGYVTLQPFRGFKVDQSGFIDYPQIGKQKVEGQTTIEVENSLTEQLKEYFVSPIVSVNIANFVISVLGEVGRPAQYVISNNMITLPQALALAGDLTIFGKRDNILIIREEEGKRHFARIDLTDRSMFESPFYYLHAGDVVYVEPRKGRLTSTDRTYQLAPVIISSLSFLMLLINSIIRYK